MGKVCCTGRQKFESEKIETITDAKGNLNELNTFSCLSDEQKLKLAELLDEYYDLTDFEEELYRYYEKVYHNKNETKQKTTVLITNQAVYLVRPNNFSNLVLRFALKDIIDLSLQSKLITIQTRHSDVISLESKQHKPIAKSIKEMINSCEDK